MIYRAITLATLFLVGQFLIPGYAETPELNPPGESPFEHGFVDIKFLNAYFGTLGQKIEVEPGNKNVPLTVVLSSSGTEDITGIRGILSLPVGFSSASSSNGLIQAESLQTAPSGQAFSLTFFVNLDNSINIHDYSGTVKITYSRVRESGERTVFFDFNFKVTGKSVLNLKADNPFLQPASNNDIAIKVENSGSGALNNVDITIQNTQNSNTTAASAGNLDNVVLDQNHWNVGTVPAGSSNSFPFKAFVPQSLAGQTVHLPLLVKYFDGQGNQITTTRTVDFIIGPASTTSILSISSPSYLLMGVMQNLTLEVQNTSPSKISDVSISITPNSNNLKIFQDNKWFIKEINPLTESKLVIPVFADSSIEGQAVNYDVNIQYTKEGSTVIEKQNFATYIRGVIDISVYGVDVSEIAEKKMIIGNVLNQGNIKAVFGSVTIEPLENSNIKKSNQYIGDIDIDAPVPFNVPVESNGELSGDQKVLVTLTYKDSLLQQHTITQVDMVSFGTAAPQTNQDFSQIQLVILLAIAAGIGGIVFKIKKSKRVPIEKTVTTGAS
ncbi:MAG: hypothetical protein E6K83_00120 [Thaumarchaeota archaeon]|nr:MAG: hypothetical protein E6K83_00120 [Nitrososphaerota archaeon]